MVISVSDFSNDPHMCILFSVDFLYKTFDVNLPLRYVNLRNVIYVKIYVTLFFVTAGDMPASHILPYMGGIKTKTAVNYLRYVNFYVT